MSNIFIGVDCGLDGAFAVIKPDSVIAEVVPTVTFHKGKTERRIYDIAAIKARILWALNGYEKDTIAAIEIQSPSFGKRAVRCSKCGNPIWVSAGGVTSAFSIGGGFWMWQTIFTMFGIRYELIPPREWQKMLSGLPGWAADRAVQFAMRFFPAVNLRRTKRCKKPHEGICDALCLAEYLRRTYSNIGKEKM